MAKKRVFLDECCAEDGLKSCFGGKAHVYIASDFAVKGKEDTTVIDKAVRKKCLIVTVNKDFVPYYRNHQLRKGTVLPYFYGLIFLKPSRAMSREKQLRTALKMIEWRDTREHDDLIFVSATGKTKHERLCHPECAGEFPAEQGEWG
jgi:hypothetical protein